jgi:hypothetical protein
MNARPSKPGAGTEPVESHSSLFSGCQLNRRKSLCNLNAEISCQCVRLTFEQIAVLQCGRCRRLALTSRELSVLVNNNASRSSCIHVCNLPPVVKVSPCAVGRVENIHRKTSVSGRKTNRPRTTLMESALPGLLNHFRVAALSMRGAHAWVATPPNGIREGAAG